MVDGSWSVNSFLSGSENDLPNSVPAGLKSHGRFLGDRSDTVEERCRYMVYRPSSDF